MTDDGRAFCRPGTRWCRATPTASLDVYEFVDGRPQLISTGTGDRTPANQFRALRASARGQRATGSTSSSPPTRHLVPQDENGELLKFYDARTNGGFPVSAFSPPARRPTSATGPTAPRRRRPRSAPIAGLGSGGNYHPKEEEEGPWRKASTGTHCHVKRSARPQGRRAWLIDRPHSPDRPGALPAGRPRCCCSARSPTRPARNRRSSASRAFPTTPRPAVIPTSSRPSNWAAGSPRREVAVLLQRPQGSDAARARRRDRQPARGRRSARWRSWRCSNARRTPRSGVVALKLFGFGMFPLYRTTAPERAGGAFRLRAPVRLLGPAVPGLQRQDRQRLRPRRQDRRHLPPPAAPRLRPDLLGRPGRTLQRLHAVQPRRKRNRLCEPTRFRPSPNTTKPGSKNLRRSTRTNRTRRRCRSHRLPQNPTTCVGPLDHHDRRFSYDIEADHAEAPWPATTGCDAAELRPEPGGQVRRRPSTDTASGLDVDLKVPQFAGPEHARRPPSSAPTRSPCRKASRSTRMRPTARPPAPTRSRRSAPKTKPNARSSPRSAR